MACITTETKAVDSMSIEHYSYYGMFTFGIFFKKYHLFALLRS